MDPLVKETEDASIAKDHLPLLIQLQNPTKYVAHAQYPVSLQSLGGLNTLIYELLRKKSTHHIFSL